MTGLLSLKPTLSTIKQITILAYSEWEGGLMGTGKTATINRHYMEVSSQ